MVLGTPVINKIENTTNTFESLHWFNKTFFACPTDQLVFVFAKAQREFL